MAEEEPDNRTYITTRWLDPEERDQLVEFLFGVRYPRWRMSHAADARHALDKYGRCRVVLQPNEEQYAAYIKLKWG